MDHKPPEIISANGRELDRTWLITGVAGFIGSNLLENLLKQNQKVTGVDCFLTGSQKNLDEVHESVTPEQWVNFKFIKADITEPNVLKDLVPHVDIVLHQAALGSVPRSIEAPLNTHKHNVDGFALLLDALRLNPKVRLVYASSSSVYGDDPGLNKIESQIGAQQSPYAATKRTNEIFAETFARTYGITCIGLRYFNVFGPRQHADSTYAAVMPKWFKALLNNEDVTIYGDGKTSRDFCFVQNVVHANLRAALTTNAKAYNQVFNIACGQTTQLNEIYDFIKSLLVEEMPHLNRHNAIYKDFRKGDIRHSLANIDKAKELLEYKPTIDVRTGLSQSLAWYRKLYGSWDQPSTHVSP